MFEASFHEESDRSIDDEILKMHERILSVLRETELSIELWE